MKNDGMLLTSTGLSDLQKELDELKNVKLPKVIDRVGKAREDGDLSENSAYIFGKQEEEFLEGRIAELEGILKSATMVVASGKKQAVDLGCRVVVAVDGKKQTFMVVGDWEAKPAEMKISGSSPLGKALMGKKVGEKVEVEAPAGKLLYTVIDIE